MFVRKSTYDALLARASTTGRALNEITGELIEGMQSMGYIPEPVHADDTTAGVVLRALKGAQVAAMSARIERDDARRERDAYREDALKYRRARANLIPGGPYRGKGSKPKPTNGAAVQGAL
jgi:hypothetical protein